MTKKAVIIEDHPLFGKSLEPLFTRLGYSEVFLHTGGEAALDCIERERPALVATDIELTGISGFDVIKACNNLLPETRFIVISMHDHPSFPKRAIGLGASGYVVKSDDEQQIRECVQQVEQGQIYISKTIAEKHPDSTVDDCTQPSAFNKPDLSLLTSQERRVLYLLQQGKTSKEIGKELMISYRTVQNHRSNVCTKFSLSGPNSLLKFAIEIAAELENG